MSIPNDSMVPSQFVVGVSSFGNRVALVYFFFFFFIQNDGYDISWMHLMDVYKEDLDSQKKRNLCLAPRVKKEHVNLTQFFCMRV